MFDFFSRHQLDLLSKEQLAFGSDPTTNGFDDENATILEKEWGAIN
jgi:hypothetical protein